MIVFGAALGFGSVLLDALVTVTTNLAILAGAFNPVSYGVVVVNAAMTGILAPVGLFLVLCGIVLAIPPRFPWRPRAFRAALGGAGLNLAAGLLLGVLNLSAYLLPPELETASFLRNAVLTGFAASVAAGAGLLFTFVGIAWLVRGEPHSAVARRAVRVRRKKSIYEGAPSSR